MITIEEHKEHDDDGFITSYIVYDINRYIGYLEQLRNSVMLHFVSECSLDDQIRILQGVKALLGTEQWKKLGE